MNLKSRILLGLTLGHALLVFMTAYELARFKENN